MSECYEHLLGRGGGERWEWRRWAEGMAESGGGVKICIKKVTWAPQNDSGQCGTAAKNGLWPAKSSTVYGKIRVAIYCQNLLKTFVLHKQYDITYRFVG